MADKYKPGSVEILGEMCRDVKDLSAITIQPYVEGLVYGTLLHWIPRFVRWVNDNPNKNAGNGQNKNNQPADHCWTAFALGGFGSSLLAQAVGYYYAYNDYHSEVLAVPVVTNLASLGYEWYRSARTRVNDRKKHPLIGLEGNLDFNKSDFAKHDGGKQ